MNCPSCGASTPETKSFCGECGSSLHPVAAADDSTHVAPNQPGALETGTTFAGRYQIIEELGRGGMGRVYKVIDNEIRGKVALKLIRPDIASEPAAIERFRRELTTARAVSHKNICRMHDLGRDGTTYFLTMEYVSGEDLKSMIGMSGQLGIGTAISIAKQVCEGLAEAHRLGVIHRDLKPQNIQIDKGGQAKIMDFGIARPALGKDLTGGGMVVGTPQYMSPEQAEAKAVDARADLYSLGVILYEMVTGRVPFDGETPLAVAMKHKLEAPRDPREMNASIPVALGQLILRCLAKDPAERYQSAGDLHADLVRIEEGLPTSSQVVPQPVGSTSKQITLPFTVRQLTVPAVAVVVLVAVVFAAWRFWPRRPAGEPVVGGRPTLALLYCEDHSGDAAPNAWRTGLPELLTTSLSQSQLLSIVSSERMFTILKNLKLADAKRFSTDDLAAVSKEAHAQYLVTCSVIKAGQSTVITTTLLRANTGDAVSPPNRIELNDAAVLAKMDGLAAKIKGDLNLSAEALARDSAQPLGEVLTSSSEALKYYSAARQHHLSGGCRDAVRDYQRAIDADPGFAMAYRGLSACSNTLGDSAAQAAAATKALQLSGRLPERFRLHVEMTANYASPTTIPKAAEAAKQLLAKYPDDEMGLTYLSLIYCAAGEYEKCVGLREAAMRIAPTQLTLSNLVSVYAQLGRDDDWKSAVDRFLEREPNNAPARAMLARYYVSQGRFEDAQREADKALVLAPGNFSARFVKGDVAAFGGDLAAAEREYLAAMDQTPEANRRLLAGRLVSLDVNQGRFEKARERSLGVFGLTSRVGLIELDAGRPEAAIKTLERRLADPVFASDPQAALPGLQALGLAAIAAGDLTRAQKALETLKAFQEGVFVRLKTWQSLTLSGALAAKRGDGRTAIAELERALAMLPRAYTGDSSSRVTLLDLLANAYTVTGDLTKARETYATLIALRADRLSAGAAYSRAFYHLGVIAQQQGDQTRARAQFQKFLDLWKNADPGQREVADAKRRTGQ